MFYRMGFLFCAILLASPNAGLAQNVKELRKCVAKIETPGHGACTAVCVSAAGHLLTVAHCRPTDETQVTLNGRRHAVRIVHRPPRSAFRPRDLPVVLKLTAGGSFPYVRIANAAPLAGERVVALGFPAGQFAAHEGTVRGIVTHNGQRLIQTSFRVYEGHSGGPLFNAQGELVGLASTRSPRPGEPGYAGGPPAANWVHTADLREAMRRANAPTAGGERRTLYIFSSKTCGGCRFVKRFEKQLRERWNPHGEVVFLEHGSERFREVAARCRTATGKAITTVPTFWVEGTSVIETDFRNFGVTAEGLNVLAVVRWALRAIAEFLIGRVQERRSQPESKPPPSSEPSTIPPDQTPDGSAVTVVVLIAKRDLGAVKGLGAKLGLKIAAGPLRRRVDRALGERAALRIVAERLQPKRFAALAQAAGLSVDDFAVVVLIEKRPAGMFRGLERRLAETILIGRLKDSPLDLIFERTHSETYAAVKSALLTKEPETTTARPSLEQRVDAIRSAIEHRIEDRTAQSERWSLLNTLLGGGGLLAGLAALWRRRREG